MQPYTYQPLDKSKEDIRLIDILPNTDFDAALELSIFHAPFIAPPEEALKDRRDAFNKIKTTLPPDWKVDETLEGRFIYWKDTNTGSSWDHPVGLDFGAPSPCPPADFQLAFEALSYVWGSPDNPETATIIDPNRSSDVRKLPLGQNLATALRHLRHSSEHRRMWVDAICINQEDLNERIDQVLRMKDIYRLSKRVVVWLGPADATSDLAMESLRRVGERLELTRAWALPPPEYTREYDWRHPTCEVPFTDAMWESIYHLLTRPWFYRVWTIQEVQLANEHCILQCGHAELRWYHFRRACRRAYGAELPDEEWYERLTTVASGTTDLSAHPFGDMLLRITDSLCTDQRDRVYGILGILPRRITRDIQPDYRESVANVYKMTVLQHASAGGRLGLLDHCDIATKLTDAPSWVPNWQIVNHSTLLSEWGYRASGCAQSRWSYSAPDVLQVDGIKQGTVMVVSPLLHDIKDLVQFIGEAYHGKITGIPAGRNLKDYVYLFNFGCTDEIHPDGDYPSWADAEQNLLDHISGKPDVEFPRHDATETRNPDAPVKMFFASGGWVGIGPGSAQPGDILAVVLGCRLPKVLRPVPETSSSGGSDHYQLLSSCHANIMNAEALLGALPDSHSARIELDKTGIPQIYFVDQETGKRIETVDDPRLGDLPDGWIRLRELNGKDDETNDGFPLWEFVNTKTGEVTRTDPRFSLEVLKAMGIELETFTLR